MKEMTFNINEVNGTIANGFAIHHEYLFEVNITKIMPQQQ